MELLKVKTTYINKKGEEKTTYNIYLVLPNGDKVLIRSVFDKDYYRLTANAKSI